MAADDVEFFDPESARIRTERLLARREARSVDLDVPYADDPLAQACVAMGPLTLEQIGELCGLTRERIRQIENKAMDSFVRKAAELGLCGDDMLEDLLERETPEPAGAWRL
jgi:transcriptional regulator with XRE-family HTH domain